MRTVVDRIEDKKWAVLLVGDEEQEFIVLIEKLPKGVREGTILDVTVDGSEIIDVKLISDSNDQPSISEKMKLLKAKCRSNFK